MKNLKAVLLTFLICVCFLVCIFNSCSVFCGCDKMYLINMDYIRGPATSGINTLLGCQNYCKSCNNDSVFLKMVYNYLDSFTTDFPYSIEIVDGEISKFYPHEDDYYYDYRIALVVINVKYDFIEENKKYINKSTVRISFYNHNIYSYQQREYTLPDSLLIKSSPFILNF